MRKCVYMFVCPSFTPQQRTDEREFLNRDNWRAGDLSLSKFPRYEAGAESSLLDIGICINKTTIS